LFIEFCKEWTKELDTNEKIENHLPITITTSDYLHSSPSLLRDARSRIVTLQVRKEEKKSISYPVISNSFLPHVGEIEIFEIGQSRQG
jgi:hypothetical protein